MPRKNRGYKSLIKKIEGDHLSGASHLSRKAAHVLTLFSRETKAKEKEVYCRALLRLGKELIAAQPGIIPIFNLVNSILYSVQEDKNALSLEELNHLVRKKAEDFHTNSLKSLEAIARIGQSLIFGGSTILTYSSSGAVFFILKRARKKGKKFNVVVSEARPMFEGRKLAEDLGKLGISVILVTDSALGLYLKGADLILVGADSVSEKTFTNKVGTYGLSLLARKSKVPFYVASERTKFTSEKWKTSLTHRADPQEVFPRKLKNVKIENPYFEKIPLSYCKKIIAPQGFLSPSQLPSVIRKTRLSRNLMPIIGGSL
jgi:translation initiation factor eIF-2B subunit delta